MALTKKDANAKYDKLRAQLKKGTISQKDFKRSADRIYNMYHSDANKKTRNAKPAPKGSTPKTSNEAKRKKAVDGVGPSDAQRRRDSSPEAMAAERAKRKKAVDGVGPSDAQRRKDSSEAAMKPKREVKGSRRRFVKSKREEVKITKEKPKYDRRGRRIKKNSRLF